MFTRLGYFVIIAIIAAAVVAIVFAVWSSFGSSDAPSVGTRQATATAQRVEITPGGVPSTISFSRVIDFARLGAVLSIDAQGQDVTVTFREDFDTSGFNTTSHVFRSSLEPGQDVIQVLQDAGIRVNGTGGVTVTKQ